MNLLGMRSNDERFSEFGTPLLSLMVNDRFKLDRVNWQGTDTDPTDTVEVSYVDSFRSDLGVRVSIKTFVNGDVVRHIVGPGTALYQHLVTACGSQILPSGKTARDLPERLEKFERRAAAIKLRDSTLEIDGEKVPCRAGTLDFMSVAETVLGSRVATLVGPDGFIEKPMTARVLPNV